MHTIKQWLEENSIEQVECLVADMTGVARGKFIPAEQFVNETVHMTEAMLLQTVMGTYCDEHYDLVCADDRDMILEADPATIRHAPWSSKPTAQIIHNCLTAEGGAHPLATRNVLRSVLAEYETMGLQPVVAPEVEFYLVKQSDDPNLVLQPPVGLSGRSESVRQPLGIDAIYEFEPFFNTLYEYCRSQQLDIGALSHEIGAAQIEVNFQHGDALSLADQVFTFKRSVRHAAFKHGLHATFMAKPMANEAGSSMHIHQSLLDIKSGENVFADSDGNKTSIFMQYIAGLQKYTPKLLSFYAPNVNSYRRFTKHLSAPTSMHWGLDNRSVAFRVPDSAPNATRVENRLAGIDCNPYLAIAASLASGLAGIKNQLQPTEAYQGNAFDDNFNVIRSLEKALDNLTVTDDFGKLISSEFINAYRHIKLCELNEYNSVISPWERENLLLNV